MTVTYYSMDVECDGPAPGLFSMVELGAVIVEPGLKRRFEAHLRPISDQWQEQALKVCNKTRAETLSYPHPATAIRDFVDWVERTRKGKAVFVDDNGFDWSFVNYYCWRYAGGNPFGHSDLNLSGVAKGLNGDLGFSLKSLRTRELLHSAVEDAADNAQIMLTLIERGLIKPHP